MAAEVRVVFDSRRELARERAKGIASGEVRLFRFAMDTKNFGLDLSTYRCGLCGGRFPEVGYADGFYDRPDDTSMTYLHLGCAKEAENWTYSPEEDDYDLYGCEVCGLPVSREGDWCPGCQKGA